jgi:hypothetical protein
MRRSTLRHRRAGHEAARWKRATGHGIALGIASHWRSAIPTCQVTEAAAAASIRRPHTAHTAYLIARPDAIQVTAMDCPIKRSPQEMLVSVRHRHRHDFTRQRVA